MSTNNTPLYLGCVILAAIRCSAIYLHVNSTFEVSCPTAINEHMMWSHTVPLGISDRALRTVPPAFSIRSSAIPEAGLGIFANTFIPRNTWLGEYEGNIVTDNTKTQSQSADSSYKWKVMLDEEVTYYIDGVSMETSNWLRYINCPRTPLEENLSVHYCYGKVYYRSKKDIIPGQELLIYYGNEYAQTLGIDIMQFVHFSC